MFLLQSDLVISDGCKKARITASFLNSAKAVCKRTLKFQEVRSSSAMGLQLSRLVMLQARARMG